MKAHLRCEYQTVTRLPRTKAILFSFKTYLYPLAQIKKEGLGPDLADAIDGLDGGNVQGMSRYKGAVKWRGRVCDYLRDID